MTEDELQDIYELTYKYGWLVTEERNENWLPDRAYLEKAKIESALAPMLDNGLDELSETYTDYVYNHTAEGWVERWMETTEGLKLDELLESLKWWAKGGTSAVSEWDIEIQFLESIYETIGEDYFKEDTYQMLGPQFIENHIEEMNDVEDQEKMAEAWDEQQSGYGPEEGAEDFIYTNDLENKFQEYVSDTQYGTLDWFVDMHTVSDANELFPSLIDNEDFYRNLFFNSYIKNFPGMENTVKEVERVQKDIETAKASNVSDKIITFQLGLNTAHQFGTMADHLLQTSMGGGQALLDAISSGPHVEEWDRDLEQIIGFKSPTESPEYFVPESKQILKAIAQLQHALELL